MSTSSSPPATERLSPTQVRVLVTLERVGGSVSLVAVLFIFVAYALVRRARNVQNTFIIFASVSNVGASVASIIALDGVRAGEDTALCQTQSFLFEMFMQSDPWWSLAMAINVFLVFYCRTSPDAFRRWWWLYCLVCYGGPFLIALVLLLIKNPLKGPVYGEATIWCWVDSQWDGVRIYSYYMLIWICIVGSFVCYFLVGYHVFRSRNRLRSFPASKNRDAGYHEQAAPDLASRAEGFYGTVVTEVRVVRTSAAAVSVPRRAHLVGASHVSFAGGSTPPPPPPPSSSAVAVATAAAERPRASAGAAADAAAAPPGPTHFYSSVTSAPPRARPGPAAKPAPAVVGRLVGAASRLAGHFVIDDPIKRAYMRTSLLFALSVLVTWIPSSLNRIHGWLVGTSPYEFHAASAAVLPLQGLWNFLIFFVTSWAAVRQHLRPGRPALPDGPQPSHDEACASSAAADASAAPAERRARARASCRPSCPRRRPSPDLPSASDTDPDDDDDDDDADSGTLGSDIELRRVTHHERRPSGCTCK